MFFMKSEKMPSLLKWLFLAIPLAFLILILRPVPPLTESNARSVSGKVIQIMETGQKDISIYLEGNAHHFYINRGLEQGLSLEGLRRDLVGREVTLVYPWHWTPLDPQNKGHHVSQVILDEQLVFSE